LSAVDLVDRFTTRAGSGGQWEVIDRADGLHERVIARCDNLKEAQAIAWFFRGDFECGTRLLLEALEELEHA